MTSLETIKESLEATFSKTVEKYQKYRLTLALIFIIVASFSVVWAGAYFFHYVHYDYVPRHKCVIEGIIIDGYKITWVFANNETLTVKASFSKITLLEKKYQLGTIYQCYSLGRKVYWHNPNTGSVIFHSFVFALAIIACIVSYLTLIRCYKYNARGSDEFQITYREVATK